PVSTVCWPSDCSAQLALGQSPRLAAAPPAARPCTKRRRDRPNGLSAPKPETADDMENSEASVSQEGWTGSGCARDRRRPTGAGWRQGTLSRWEVGSGAATPDRCGQATVAWP